MNVKQFKTFLTVNIIIVSFTHHDSFSNNLQHNCLTTSDFGGRTPDIKQQHRCAPYAYMYIQVDLVSVLLRPTINSLKLK